MRETTQTHTERWIASAVVVVPTLATIYALYAAFVYGVPIVAIWLFASFYVATLFGVEAGFHRYAAHQSFACGRFMRWLILGLGSMAAQGPVIFWVAKHRAHHLHVDADGDPHSPCVSGDQSLSRWRGLMHAHVGWLFLESNRQDTMAHAVDLLKDRDLLRLNRGYFNWVLLGLAMPTGIGFLAIGGLEGALSGLIWGGLVRIFAVHHVVWAVNSICHTYGRAPFEVKGESRNNSLLALPSLGGAWHNNHHAFPYTADNQFEWWQVDVCGLMLRAFEQLGWVTKLKKPSAERLAARRMAT